MILFCPFEQSSDPRRADSILLLKSRISLGALKGFSMIAPHCQQIINEQYAYLAYNGQNSMYFVTSAAMH